MTREDPPPATKTTSSSTPPPPAESTATRGDAADPFDAVRASWGFPAFARAFPRDEELDALVAAFTRGDYATVRVRAPALAAKATDPEIKRAAELLRARIEPDPTSRVIFLVTATLLAFLTVWWVAHDGPPTDSPPAPTAPVPTVEYVK